MEPLQETIAALAQGPQTYTFTWSVIPAGVAAGSHTTVEVKSPDDFVDNAAFVVEAASAMARWKAMFESVFSVGNGYANQLTLNFTYEGIETGSPPETGTGIQSYLIPSDYETDIEDSALFETTYGNVGEIRVSMHPFVVKLRGVTCLLPRWCVRVRGVMKVAISISMPISTGAERAMPRRVSPGDLISRPSYSGILDMLWDLITGKSIVGIR